MKKNLVFTKDEIIRSLENVGIELIDSNSANTVQMISENGAITELSYDFNIFDDLMFGINIEYVATITTDDPDLTLKMYSADPKYYSIFNEDGDEEDGIRGRE